MATIADNLQAVRERIAHAARAAGREAEKITLLAVSKTHPAQRVLEAVAAGQRTFGENYVQEAVSKMDAVAAASDPSIALEWHLIGPLQSNKTRTVAERFDWVQTIDREKIAARLSAQRAETRAPLNVLVQVNVSGEASKSGVAPESVLALAQAVARLPRLRLRGLMTIPEPTDDVALQRSRFRRLRELLEAARASGLALDTLSMGMSDDMEAAIAEGATMVRIGTAIFGARETERGAA
ncbi:MAG: YggS family pyridoxal phosphate-dependent enzyme [Burkholderiales bacterium]